jgi:branched-chain amino acid aminotransferase
MRSLVFLNGVFVTDENARVSIFDRGFCYGDGLFETMRAYKGKVFRLDLHLDRLYQSAPLIHLDLPVTRKEIRAIIRETLKINKVSDAIVRLTLTRGESISGLRIDPNAPPTMVVHTRPLEHLPEHMYQDGVNISLIPSSAGKIADLRVQVKSGNYLSRLLLREMASANKCQEAILLDENNKVTDGTTSNIFMVRDNILITPQVNEYVLPGVTRHVVLEIARKRGVPCSEQILTCQDIYSADEVFLTNTGIEILPVRQADNQIIGDGKPGLLTKMLHREFLKFVDEHVS